MPPKVLDGKILSAQIRAEIKESVSKFRQDFGRAPGLATILVGENPASHTYIASKVKACNDVGMTSFHTHLPKTATPAEISTVIDQLNADDRVDAILLQLPLPDNMDSTPLLERIRIDKDADGLHPFNLGQLFEYRNWDDVVKHGYPLSCTPHGVIQVLQRSQIQIAGKKAVVLGRSKLVGKPMALMLLALDATVTMAHSRTKDLAEVCKQADILVAAVGQPRFVKATMVKAGATVIDVGINRAPEGGLCGDVDYESVKAVASAITPVPGGIGPMTVAMLLHNTLSLARKRIAQPKPTV